VVDELVARGVPEDRLTATGAGETEPIGPNDTEEGRARNRRIELIVGEGG
jgi:OOP family OmpA-OmpF porin